MMTGLLIGLVTVAVLWWTTPQQGSPDGRFYKLTQVGAETPRPYYLRLLPRLLPPSDSGLEWRLVCAVSLVLTSVAMSIYSGGSWVAVALLMALPGVSLVAWRFPVLVDPPAYALALVSAALVVTGHPVIGALFALAAGATKESAPVFAALWAWSPWPLLGLLVPAVAYATVTPGKVPEWAHEWLASPRAAARAAHSAHALDGRVMLAPWGACLAALTAPTLPIMAALGVAYAQLVTANDLVRLYQWAAPPVAVAAASVIPAEFALAVVGLHVFNPWKGAGI